MAEGVRRRGREPGALLWKGPWRRACGDGAGSQAPSCGKGHGGGRAETGQGARQVSGSQGKAVKAPLGWPLRPPRSPESWSCLRALSVGTGLQSQGSGDHARGYGREQPGTVGLTHSKPSDLDRSRGNHNRTLLNLSPSTSMGALKKKKKKTLQAVRLT